MHRRTEKNTRHVADEMQRLSISTTLNRPLTFAVLGHIDAGKSTLVGNLLHKTGSVCDQQVGSLKEEARSSGKGSFALAWLLDESEEERSRGVTRDTCTVTIKHPTLHPITLIDCPGHRDFVPNALSGIVQADVGILVIDCSFGEFETGLENQTNEHLLLLVATGLLKSLIIVLNKADRINWDEERLALIKGVLFKRLVELGFSDFRFVAVSALSGVNIADRRVGSEPTLIEELFSSTLNQPQLEGELRRHLRIVINDIVPATARAPFYLAARVEAGFLNLGKSSAISLTIVPGNAKVRVKRITRIGLEDSLSKVIAGDLVAIFATEDALDCCQRGYVLCSPEKPITAHSSFEVDLRTWNLSTPITVGFRCTLHAHGMERTASVLRLEQSSSGSLRMIGPNSKCIALVQVDVPVPLDLYSDSPATGRCILRYRGSTVATCQVTRLPHKT